MKNVRAFGKPLQAMVEWVGDLGLFCWRVAKAIFSPPFEGAEFLRQLDAIGAKSLPLACLAGRQRVSFCLCKPATALHGSAPSLCYLP